MDAHLYALALRFTDIRVAFNNELNSDEVVELMGVFPAMALGVWVSSVRDGTRNGIRYFLVWHRPYVQLGEAREAVLAAGGRWPAELDAAVALRITQGMGAHDPL